MIALAFLGATALFLVTFFAVVEHDLKAFDEGDDLLPFFFSIFFMLLTVSSFMGFCLQIQS